MKLFQKMWRDEEGQDLVEYALLVALIAVAVAVVLPNLATAIGTAFSNIETSLTSTGA